MLQSLTVWHVLAVQHVSTTKCSISFAIVIASDEWNIMMHVLFACAYHVYYMSTVRLFNKPVKLGGWCVWASFRVCKIIRNATVCFNGEWNGARWRSFWCLHPNSAGAVTQNDSLFIKETNSNTCFPISIAHITHACISWTHLSCVVVFTWTISISCSRTLHHTGG